MYILSEIIKANTQLATIVRQGYHAPSTDTDYVDIDWTMEDCYAFKITVTNNSGQTSNINLRRTYFLHVVGISLPRRLPPSQTAAAGDN
ncbi:hypothetical protein [Cohnella abietis]|uniref:Uncharacterized protein n=1 Tax=Cohnella abietis TaxID=2507935 RepID=A0A3T1DE18_9BACL|nr:hypothetical protein [Cohnella abietis]BBI36401.1 hypothetical protein KCTCHS21_58000 [Cohnella abietis]